MSATINVIKEKRGVSEELKEENKRYNRIKRAVLKSLENGKKTIPEISSETGIAPEIVTYNLMTSLKYGSVVVEDIDDMDEYYYYQLKK